MSTQESNPDSGENNPSMRRLKTALKSVGMGVWEWNVTKDILIWDDSLYELYEVDRKDFTNNFDAWARTAYPSDAKIVREELLRSAREEKDFETEFRSINPEGKVKWIKGRAKIVKDSNGDTLLVGCNWDITETKEAQLNLIQSSKMASLGEMASGIAHEINNPLAIISAKCQQLRRKLAQFGMVQEDALRDLGKIEDTAQRIFKVIKGLRSFSRNAEFDPFFDVAIEPLIFETLELCKQRFISYGIDVRTSGDFSGTIECRTAQVQQVLLNLLNNSFDAIQGTENAWVEVSVEKFEDDIFISITDSGKGIDADIVERIMLPFFTTKPVGQGTGLGLSISKGLVESHQGRLYYDEKSPTTRFVMVLPCRRKRV